MDSIAYLRILLKGFLGLLAILALFCRVVDPFWYYGDVRIDGFNAIKTEFKRFERYVKPRIVLRERPRSLIFGSSYAEIGFDPLHPALTRNGSERSYNFALAGSEWNRVYCTVQFALQQAPPARVVLGLQPELLGPVDCRPILSEMLHIPTGALLLSRKAVQASIHTVRSQNKPPTHTAEGLFFYTRFEFDDVERRFQEDLFRYLAHVDAQAPCRQPGFVASPTAGGALAAANVGWQGRRQDLGMEGLVQLLMRLVHLGVETRLVIYPVHAMRAEADILCGRGEVRWQFLEAIARAVQRVDPEGRWVELWDFQGFDPALAEPIQNGRTRYWQDVGHFNFELGNRMLDRMFLRRGGAEDFGVVLTPGDLPRQRQRFFRAREAFLRSHPEFLAELSERIGRFRHTH
jgi:hypothetical protein